MTAPRKLINSSKFSSNIKNRELRTANTKFRLNVFGKNVSKLVKRFGKDESYYINRYVHHPYYKYKIYWIYSLNKVLGFLVTRICKFKNRKALRIVDFFGYDKALININYPLQKLLTKIGAEYADFYENAIDNFAISNSGLYENKFNNKIVVPNYFEPFIKKNVSLKWALKSSYTNAFPIFKGDCDQDRPSIL